MTPSEGRRRCATGRRHGTVVAVGGSGVDRLERIGIELSDGTMMISARKRKYGCPVNGPQWWGSSGSETILLVPEDGLQPAAAFRTVDGGSGDDLIEASAIVTSVLRITGGNGNDTLFGGGGRDFLVGRGGDDSIVGGVANDTIIAGAGDDQLFGGRSDDSLDGGEGNDTIDGGEGNDRIPTGPGIDRLRLRDGEADTIFGTDDEDELLLDEFDETLPTPP